jgi:PAS domain S-box-containing protein
MENEAAFQLQSRLREQEATYRSVLDSIDAGFCIIELAFDGNGCALDYRFLEVNPAFERQTGLIDASGQWMRRLAPAHEQHWFDIYGAVALSGEPVRFEKPANALQNRWFDVYAFRIGEPNKRHVAILFNDITARKRSEAALQEAYREVQQMSAELRRSNEELDQFARIASHDLQAPVHSIVQFSQLILSRSQDVLDPETREFVEHIVGTGKRMAGLLDDLLKYAMLAHGPSEASAPVRAGAACSQAAEHLRIAIEESESVVECDIARDVSVRLELSLLTLVFQNLVANAVHYRRYSVKPQIQIGATSEGSFWKFAVRDNGEGIEMRFRDRIFEPFGRLHGQERPGNGIGLATCKRILERAEGRIWVESQIGEGSTFYFVLPKAMNCPANAGNDF